MSHCSMFKACDNKDGFVSVIVHRERYIDDLKAMGFVESVNDLKPVEKKKPGPKPKKAEVKPEKEAE